MGAGAIHQMTDQGRVRGHDPQTAEEEATVAALSREMGPLRRGAQK